MNFFEKTIIGFALMAFVASAWAACSYNSIVSGGRTIICSTCCDDNGGNCVTVCN